MAVEPTEDNPHGWGYIEKRKVLEHYQLSPRIQIVIGDIIKVTQGDYFMKDGGKVSLGSMQGQWRVDGIFEADGDVEMAIRQVWSGGMLGQSDLIRITGEERPSKLLPDVIINRPNKIKLAVPRCKRKTKRERDIGKSYVKKIKEVKKVEEVKEDVDWNDLANIVKENSSD